MLDSLLPPSIKDERSLALEAVINRLPALDLSVLSIYDIDNVNADALPLLAEQFDVAGLRGYLLCSTDAERRNLIKRAIALHRYAGTPWSVREAIAAVGFAGAEIEENPAFLCNGEIYSNGSDYCDGRIWGGFRVFVDKGNKALTQQQEALLTSLILEWKNARSELLSVGIRQELLLCDGRPNQLCDGTALCDGSIDADSYTFFCNGAQLSNGVWNPDGVPALDADTVAWRDRIIANGGTVSDAVVTAAETHIFNPLKPIKAKIRQLLLLVGDGLDAARTAAYGNDAAWIGFVGGDFTQATGLQGGTGKAIDSALDMTGVTTSAYGLVMYGADLTGSSRILCGSGTPTAVISNFASTLTADINGQAQKLSAPITTGMFSAQSVSATDLRLYENGVEVRLSAASRAQTNITQRPYYMARNNAGSLDWPVPSTGKLWAAATTNGLTSAENTLLYDQLRAFNLAIARTGVV